MYAACGTMLQPRVHDRLGVAMSATEYVAEEQAEHREIVRRAATNHSLVVGLFSLGLLGFWLGITNMSLSEVATRWIVRLAGPAGDPENAHLFYIAGCGFMVLSGLAWLFSGNGNRAFEMTQSGILVHSPFGAREYRWSDFTHLERNVGKIVLFAPEVPGGPGLPAVVFKLSGLDWSSTELEALIVYHRPDLFSPRSQFGVTAFG
jgi:hypothetical protein